MGDLMHCDEHSGLMEALNAIKADTAKIPALDKKVDLHLQDHTTREKVREQTFKTMKIVGIAVSVGATLFGAAWAIASAMGGA